MQGIERLIPSESTHIERIKAFVAMGRLQLSEARANKTAAYLARWLVDYCSSDDGGNLAADVREHLKTANGTKKDVVLLKNAFWEPEWYGKHRAWEKEKSDDYFLGCEIRQKNRRGPLIGVQLEWMSVESNWVQVSLDIYDQPAAKFQVQVDQRAVSITPEGFNEEGLLSLAKGTDAMVYLLESMPEIGRQINCVDRPKDNLHNSTH